VASSVGLARTTAFSTALLTGTAPLFAALLAGALRLEAVRRGQVAGMLVALLGVMVFMGEKLRDALPAAGVGDLLSLMGALFFAAFSVTQKPLLDHYHVPVVMAYTCTLGALPVLLLSWPAALAQTWSELSPAASLSLAWSIVAPVYVAWSMWAWATARIGVGRTSVFMFLVPVAGGAVSRVLFGEVFDALKLGGAVLILAGLAVNRRAGTRAPVAPPAMVRARP
jgi:drug/metabolite transporter (DMT)-like permease